MKRFIAVLLVIQLLLLAGCTFPFFGKSAAQPSGIAEGQDMIKVEGNGQLDSAGSDVSDNVLKDTADGSSNSTTNGTTNDTTNSTTNDTTNDTTNGVTSGSSVAAAIGVMEPDVSTDASGTAIASSVSSASTGTASDNAVSGIAQTTIDSGNVLAETRRPVTVYYQDGDGYLVPMTRWIQRQQGIARAAVSLGIDSAIAREEVAYYGVYPVIPVDTDILGIDIFEGIATIDFDRHLLNYNSAASERNIIASIVYTLTEFTTVDKVRILVNGYPQDILKYGTDVSGALGREDISINTDASLQKDSLGKADIFLFKKANEGFTYLVPVSVAGTEAESGLPEMLVKQLLRKGSDENLYTEMPNGAALLNCSTDNGVLMLDFSKSFTDYGGNAREEGILKQLAYTVRQVEGIKRLKILVEGQKAELPEGTDISAGLAIPATINDVMDR